MKYICLGYVSEESFGALAESERKDIIADCLAYDDEMRATGSYMGGHVLQSVQNATTLRLRGGKVSITDGPFAETKEHLGGIIVLEAKDLNHAISIMSKHPGLRLGGCWEIRPETELPTIYKKD